MGRKFIFKTFIIIFILSILLKACPEKCSCRYETIDCSGQSLTVEEVSSIGMNWPKGYYTLNLEDNNLKVFPSDDFKNTSLEELLLRKNKLSKLPKSLKNMWQLDVGENEIEDLKPEHLIGYMNLQSLIIDKNKLSQIRANVFEHARKLSDIDLSHNQIASINEKALQGHPNLQRLNLNHNKIKALHKNIFVNIKYLMDVSIKANLLKEIPRDLLKCVDLEDLDLSQNIHLKSLPLGFLRNADRILGLVLINTNIPCNCQTYFALSEVKSNDLYIRGKCRNLNQKFFHLSAQNILNCHKCDTKICGNHATCQRNSQGYKCICDKGYEGKHCDVKIQCIPNPCGSKGMCVPVNKTYVETNCYGAQSKYNMETHYKCI